MQSELRTNKNWFTDLLRACWGVINFTRNMILNIVFLLILAVILMAFAASQPKPIDIKTNSVLKLAIVGDVVEELTFVDPYDEVVNPQNNVIGAKMAAYFNASLSANFPITKSLDVVVAGDFIHMSNGSARQPNVGIDMYGGSLGLRWNFDRKKYWTGEKKYNNKRLRGVNPSH